MKLLLGCAANSQERATVGLGAQHDRREFAMARRTPRTYQVWRPISATILATWWGLSSPHAPHVACRLTVHGDLEWGADSNLRHVGKRECCYDRPLVTRLNREGIYPSWRRETSFRNGSLRNQIIAVDEC